MDLNSRIKYWLPVILYGCFIFYTSSIPAPELPITGVDLSIIHIPEFFILSYLIFRALSREETNLWYTFILSILISTFYGITDEIHQFFVLGRYFSGFDIIFNFIGSSLILFKFWRSSWFEGTIKRKLFGRQEAEV